MTCTVNPNGWGYFQFNITSTIDNDTVSQIGNTSLSVRIRVHSIDDAPVLQTASQNITNSSSPTSDWINTSISVLNVDLNKTNVTAVLFINNKVNITVQLLNDWINGSTAVYVFNNTNVSANDVVNVQFNASDGLASNYINSSKVTISAVAAEPGLKVTLNTNALLIRPNFGLNNSVWAAEPQNQTSTLAIFNVTNNGTDSGTVQIRANITGDRVIECANNYFSSGHVNWTSTDNGNFKTIISSLSQSSPDNNTGVWCRWHFPTRSNRNENPTIEFRIQ